jgi:hypothetical protein
MTTSPRGFSLVKQPGADGDMVKVPGDDTFWNKSPPFYVMPR